MSSRFKRIYIEISNICNLQCTFCPDIDREKKILSPFNFKKILSDAAPLADEVCLHLMGEPLSHPDFNQILKICDEEKVACQITTNGILLRSRKEVLLDSKYLRQINFSLQSYKDNFLNKSLDDYLRPLLNFTQELHERRPEVYVNFRLWNLGRESSVMSENEEILSLLERFYGVEINRRVHVDSIKSKRIWNRVYLHFDSHFEWPSTNSPYAGKSGRCHALSHHIGIHSDGTVVPCCLDKDAQVPLGNCLEDDLPIILKSPRAEKMKMGFLNNQLIEELCQHCTYIKRFS